MVKQQVGIDRKIQYILVTVSIDRQFHVPIGHKVVIGIDRQCDIPILRTIAYRAHLSLTYWSK